MQSADGSKKSPALANMPFALTSSWQNPSVTWQAASNFNLPVAARGRSISNITNGALSKLGSGLQAIAASDRRIMPIRIAFLFINKSLLKAESSFHEQLDAVVFFVQMYCLM